MPPPAQLATGHEPKPSEKIPPINIAPSIFVPLREDILNSELPRDRVERLKRILKTVDCQREGVRENLLYMFEREKKRIMMQAAEMEQLGPPTAKPGLPLDEVDRTISNMEAAAEPGVDYTYREPTASIKPILPDALLQDRTVLELLNVVEMGLEQLTFYEMHITGIKEHYLRCLEKEMARIDEAGKRPEERSGARGF